MSMATDNAAQTSISTLSTGDSIPLSRIDTGPGSQSPDIQSTEPPLATDSTSETTTENESSGAQESHSNGLKTALTRFVRACLSQKFGAVLAIAAFIFNLIGFLYFSYRADQNATWTTAKDFFGQCQTLWVRQSLKYVRVSQLMFQVFQSVRSVMYPIGRQTAPATSIFIR